MLRSIVILEERMERRGRLWTVEIVPAPRCYIDDVWTMGLEKPSPPGNARGQDLEYVGHRWRVERQNEIPNRRGCMLSFASATGVATMGACALCLPS